MVRDNVRIMVRVNELLGGSDLGQGMFRVSLRVRVKLGLGWQFDPNNLLTVTFNRNPPNLIKARGS